MSYVGVRHGWYFICYDCLLIGLGNTAQEAEDKAAEHRRACRVRPG